MQLYLSYSWSPLYIIQATFKVAIELEFRTQQPVIGGIKLYLTFRSHKINRTHEESVLQQRIRTLFELLEGTSD